MDYSDTLFDKIETYLRGKMSAAEAAAFERQIAADPELAELVEMQRFEQDGLEFLLEEDLKKKIDIWKTSPPPGMTPPRSRGRSWWVWAILLLAVFVAVGIWCFSNKIETPVTAPTQQQTPPPVSTKEKPIAETETTPKTPPETQPPPKNERSRYLAISTGAYKQPEDFNGKLKSTEPANPATDNPLDEGIRLYTIKEYEKAIQAWEKITPQDDQYALAQKWMGHALYKLGVKNGDFAPAAAIFQAMADKKTNDSAQQDEAEWYLLLCLLPDYPQHKKQVDDLLLKMTKMESHSYHDDAIEIQKKLRAN